MPLDIKNANNGTNQIQRIRSKRKTKKTWTPQEEVEQERKA